MVDQLPDIEQFFRALSPDPEQVIEVPKILPFGVPMRTAVRDTQLAEQLVEVPIISYSSLQRTVEQHVDIPVPGGGGPRSGLQGFSSGQSSTATLPLRNAFLSGLWSTSLLRFPVEVFMVLSQDTVHLLLTLQQVLKSAQMSLVKGFFALFPKIKKV